jgi:ribosomal protein S21
MHLHEAIDKVLRENKRPMSSRELADEINARGLYIRPSDGRPPQATQVGARVRHRTYRDQYRIDADHRISPA